MVQGQTLFNYFKELQKAKELCERLEAQFDVQLESP